LKKLKLNLIDMDSKVSDKYNLTLGADCVHFRVIIQLVSAELNIPSKCSIRVGLRNLNNLLFISGKCKY